MKIDIVCNNVPGGWLPENFDGGMGGSEESIICFAREMARRGHSVAVYHPRPPDAQAESLGGGESDLTVWRRLEDFPCFAGEGRDLLISYRNWELFHSSLGTCPAGARIHWSVDVEPVWRPQALAAIAAYVCLTDYHRARQAWVPERLGHVIPYGTNLEPLDASDEARHPNLALYCASPDRGLETLLRDWPKIREHHPDLQLVVSYGWSLFDAYTRGSRDAWKKEMLELLGQPGITDVGKSDFAGMADLYRSATYWIHPLNRPDSELFCLNATKSRYCGAIPVVIRQGALRNTVGRHIPYADFIEGSTERVGEEGAAVPVLPWDEVVDRYWEPLLDRLIAPAPGPCTGSRTALPAGGVA